LPEPEESNPTLHLVHKTGAGHSEAEVFLKAIKGSRALAIKGFLEDLGKGLGAVGTFFQALEFYHTAQRAEAHGLSPWLQYLIESGMAENPYIES
jgi:hypothetical protein